LAVTAVKYQNQVQPPSVLQLFDKKTSLSKFYKNLSIEHCLDGHFFIMHPWEEKLVRLVYTYLLILTST